MAIIWFENYGMRCETGLRGKSAIRFYLSDGEPVKIELENNQWRNLLADMTYRDFTHREVIEITYQNCLHYRERSDERFIQTFVNLYALWINTGASMRHEDQYPVANQNGELWSSVSG